MELPLAGIILNRMPTQPDLAAAEAPHQLASLASTDLLGVLPEVAGTPEEQIERLSEIIAGLPTLPGCSRVWASPCRHAPDRTNHCLTARLLAETPASMSASTALAS